MSEQQESQFIIGPVYQLGYVVSDIPKVCEYYESTFGIKFSDSIDVDMEGAILRGKPISTKIKVAFAQSGDVQLELIQPVEGENLYTEFLSSKDDGIHHLAFQVEDIDAAKADFAKKGLEPIYYHDMGVMEFAYYDTSGIGGLMIELLYWKTGT